MGLIGKIKKPHIGAHSGSGCTSDRKEIVVVLGRGQREWIVSIWGQSWSSLIIPAGKVSVGIATVAAAISAAAATISAGNDYNGIDRAQACLVKNVSPIISIQQPMNNGVGVYLFTWVVVDTVATTTA